MLYFSQSMIIYVCYLKKEGKPMFEEDPFDRWCRIIFALIIFVTGMTELIIRHQFRLLTIRGRYLLVVVWLRTRSLCFTVYRKHICLPLMFCGFMKVPTWTEVEAYRLRLIAQSGYDLPRPLDLEEGLLEERLSKE